MATNTNRPPLADIHKAGGTSFCQSAHVNGEAASPTHNCNVDKASNNAVQSALRMNLELNEQKTLLSAIGRHFSFVANGALMAGCLFYKRTLQGYVSFHNSVVPLP
jgi:hypothetical protein